MGTDPPIALCPRCRHRILPRLAQPSWHQEKHRASAAEREDEPDPRADAIRRRKEAKRARAAQLRKQMRVSGILAAARFFLDVTKHPAAPPREDPATIECPDCLKLQRPAA